MEVAKMMNRFKDFLKLNNKDDISEKAAEALEKKEELVNKMKRLEEVVKAWEEHEAKVKLLLPFEKINKLKAEEKLLETKKEILYQQFVYYKEIGNNSEAQAVSKIRKEITDKLQKKEDEIIEACNWSHNLGFRNGIHLFNDPRDTANTELSREKEYKKCIKTIDKQIELLEGIINQNQEITQNRKEIMQLSRVKLLPMVSLPVALRDQINELEKLKDWLEGRIKHDWVTEIDEANEKIEEVRSYLIEKEEFEKAFV